jgi:drug/metabolite transporter (DMT)-like permease
MRLIEYAALLILAAIWGSSYLFIRVAVPALGPPALIDARVLLAGGALLLLLGPLNLMRTRATGYPRERSTDRRSAGSHTGLASIWRPMLLLGAVNAALPFTLIALAELRLPASLASILNATTPLFTALVAAVWLGDALTRRKTLGLVLGLAGVAAVVGWSPTHLSLLTVASAACSLLAALCYGIGGVYARTRFREVGPLTLAAGQQLAAGLLLLPVALADPPAHSPSLRATASVLALALLCTSVAYLLYFSLIGRVGPTSTHTYAFLVPLFGVLWGAIFLGERVPPGVILGLALILTGMALVTGLRWPRADTTDPPTARGSPAILSNRSRREPRNDAP